MISGFRLDWLCAAALTMGVVACAPRSRLEAASGGTAERTAVNGFSLTASVNAWPGGNRQLVGRVIPVWIQLKNRSAVPVRVRYDDLGAVDEQGYWFGLVDPRTGRIVDSPAMPAGAPAEPPTRGAWRSGASQGWVAVDVERTAGGEPLALPVTTNGDAIECEQSSACGEVTLLPTWHDDTEAAEVTLVQHRWGMGGRGFSGPPRSGFGYSGYYGYWGGYSAYPFYGYPGYYGYYGWGWPYYDSAYYWPYYSYGYGRAANGERLPTTATMVHVALAEGELKPGAATAGFVYFPSAARRATRLDVTWAVHSTQGQPIIELAARFVVVADE